MKNEKTKYYLAIELRKVIIDHRAGPAPEGSYKKAHLYEIVNKILFGLWHSV